MATSSKAHLAHAQARVTGRCIRTLPALATRYESPATCKLIEHGLFDTRDGAVDLCIPLQAVTAARTLL